MRARIAGCLVVIALILCSPHPSHAVVCVSTSVQGTYVMTFGGVDAAGSTVSNLAVATFGTGDTNGNGTLTGTLFVNERGQPPRTQALVGAYQIQSNCWITIRIQDTVDDVLRFNGLTGFVANAGALIVFSSPFDAGVQLTGLATFVPF